MHGQKDLIAHSHRLPKYQGDHVQARPVGPVEALLAFRDQRRARESGLNDEERHLS